MRQVPHPLIVGDGKMATHFGHYLSLLGIDHTRWSRRTHSPDSLEILFSTATLTLVLISDAAIELFIENHAFLRQKPIIHFSGALTIPGTCSTHPLMTFSEKLYSLEFYQKIPFILEADQDNFLDFLPNSFYAIPVELKSYYHMLCTLSGNFTCILWQKFFNEFETTFQLPSHIGELYLQQITQNIMHNPNTALTGPLIRNDHHTIEKHLAVLENDEFKNIYHAFVDLFNKGERKINEHP